MLKIYNTLTKKVDFFKPIDEKKVRMYVCGPTVYDKIHIGNARSLIVFDVIYRVLRKIYGKEFVIYVRNITDIDDKIINKATELNVDIEDITKENIKNFNNDCQKLNLLSPTFEPKATEHLDEMGVIINKLKNDDFAYEKNQHVYFNVKKYNDYGLLSNKKIKENINGIRVKVSEDKIDTNDFVLWKPAKENEVGYKVKGLPYGRPGWHIECSAMANKFLGNTFDIHGGGMDLMFPHHENEIAQSCCCFNTKYLANYFVHNGFLNFNDIKMSKSLGNIMKLDEFLLDYEILRMVMLLTNYSHPLNFKNESITLAKNILDKFYDIIKEEKLEYDENSVDEDFLNFLLNDFNTVMAIKRMQELLEKLKNAKNDDKQELKIRIFSSMNFLGLMQKSYVEYINNNRNRKGDTNLLSTETIEKLIEERKQAKMSRDFRKADEIRDNLLENGILLQDVKGKPTSWSYKK